MRASVYPFLIVRSSFFWLSPLFIIAATCKKGSQREENTKCVESGSPKTCLADSQLCNIVTSQANLLTAVC